MNDLTALPARRRRLSGSGIAIEPAGEINLVPYLDVMINLIMFILLTMTALLAFGAINASAPRHVRPSEDPSTVAAPGIGLLVVLTDRGYWISGGPELLRHPVATRLGLDTSNASRPTLPRGPDGAYDRAALGRAAESIKAAFPAESNVILFAEPDVAYEDVVAALDVLREAEGHPLFPDVMFNATLD